ncbi:MAG: hypothetical protein M3Z02_01760 [Actinomycetota bacterium]|nr:hypothetical protein [Actinomycetota bacterium]
MDITADHLERLACRLAGHAADVSAVGERLHVQAARALWSAAAAEHFRAAVADRRSRCETAAAELGAVGARLRGLAAMVR